MNYWLVRAVVRRSAFVSSVDVVASSKCTVVLGANGSGKSTLLELLAGGLAPDEGEVWIQGQRVASSARILVGPRERNVGYLPQGGGLFPWLSVQENLQLGFRGRFDAASHCRTWGVDVGRSQVASTLSGGMKQRVAIARVMLRKFGLYLFDEPTSMIDVPSRVRLVRQMIEACPAPSVWVTHQPELLGLLPKPYILYMGEGRIEWAGDLYECRRAGPSFLQKMLS